MSISVNATRALSLLRMTVKIGTVTTMIPPEKANITGRRPTRSESAPVSGCMNSKSAAKEMSAAVSLLIPAVLTM